MSLRNPKSLLALRVKPRPQLDYSPSMRAWDGMCSVTAWIKSADEPTDDEWDLFFDADDDIWRAFPNEDPNAMTLQLLIFAAFARPWPSTRPWDASRVLSEDNLRRLIVAYKRENGPCHAIA